MGGKAVEKHMILVAADVTAEGRDQLIVVSAESEADAQRLLEAEYGVANVGDVISLFEELVTI
ncbi:hypothetical protein LH19_01000 [Sphingopyxis macrogoltabida]|nr:hypothetical protein LH19_01000 [Sphingopyxis macrogoltabida]